MPKRTETQQGRGFRADFVLLDWGGSRSIAS